MSILKTESIASRPISDVYSPRVFSVPRGLKSTRTIACTPCTGSISPLRSILSSSSSSKRERERERKKESVSILAERAHNVQFVLDNTHKRERERKRNALSMLPPPAFAIFARAFSLAFADFCPFPPPMMKLSSSSSSSKRIVVHPPSRRALSSCQCALLSVSVEFSPPFVIFILLSRSKNPKPYIIIFFCV